MAKKVTISNYNKQNKSFDVKIQSNTNSNSNTNSTLSIYDAGLCLTQLLVIYCVLKSIEFSSKLNNKMFD